MVTLVPMTADTFERWRVAAIRGYAEDKVRVGAWPASEALARSERAFAELLPEGRATVGHELCSIVEETGAIVGALWFGPVDSLGPGTCFIWDIEVAPEARGRGHGRAALQALEPIARELGYDAIALHVFADNDVARSLYRSSGYVETDVSMRKRLG
jgi:ribosomal protein S18 acetylase RimI-like enzyme